MASSSLEHPRRNSFQAWLQDSLVVLLVTLLTALLALVVEDAIPTEGDARWIPVRLWATGIVGIALVIALYIRQRRVRFRGTLYYVRYLAEWMDDEHLTKYESARGGHRDARVVAAWMTTSPKRSPGLSGLDIADDVASLSRELASTMNNDDAGTAFNIAPNLLWPAAVAVGYDTYSWPETKLEEAGDPRVGTGGLSWSPNASPPADTIGPYIAARRKDVSESTTAVLITARFTGGADIRNTDYLLRYHYDLTAQIGQSSALEDAFFAPWPEVAAPVKVTDRMPRGLAADTVGKVVLHPATVVTSLVSTIYSCLHNYPQSPILLYLRVPKTVAFALGMQLNNPPDGVRLCGTRPGTKRDPSHPCIHPWRRLIPILIDQEQTTPPGSLVVRAHPAQPCLGILQLRARGGRINAAAEAHHRANCDCS